MRRFRDLLVLVGIGALVMTGAPAPSAAAGPNEGPAWDVPGPGIGGTVLGDGLIVPGDRIGPVRLTMAIDEIIATVGRQFRRDVFPQEGIILYEWRSEGLWVSQTIASRAIRVISVFGTSDRYRTEKGVSLLETRARMEAAHGRDYREYRYPADRITLIRYHAVGLQFGLVNQPSNAAIHHRIFQIGIFKPGDLPPLRRPSN
ncbi:MAG: hypothetical protein QN131_10270 [Armatimonadota bacterium]|nr:hypothetical protein [Armatimonadota bacterium]MDR7550306.1 hypothetical protein [Armatimonadota bacterium]